MPEWRSEGELIKSESKIDEMDWIESPWLYVSQLVYLLAWLTRPTMNKNTEKNTLVVRKARNHIHCIILAYLLIYPINYPPTYLLIFLSIYLHYTYLPTFLPTYLHHTGIHPLTYLTTHFPPYQSLHLPKHTNSPTNHATNPQVHTSTNGPNQPAAFHTSTLQWRQLVGGLRRPPPPQKKIPPIFFYCFIDSMFNICKCISSFSTF